MTDVDKPRHGLKLFAIGNHMAQFTYLLCISRHMMICTFHVDILSVCDPTYSVMSEDLCQSTHTVYYTSVLIYRSQSQYNNPIY